jgi:uncharacterized protein YkwD
MLRPRWAVLPAGAVVAALAFWAATLTGDTAETRADTTLDSEEQAFMSILNDYRAANQLPPVIIDSSLQAAAEWMSTDMGEENYFDHDDSLGRDPWTRLCDFNYCYNTWKGENIAAGYTTGADVFEGWRASSGHNRNMLGVHYVVMGLARVHTPGSTYGWYWTNDFGGLQVEPSPPAGPTNTPSPSPTATQQPTPTPTEAPTPSPTPTPSPSPVPTTPKPTKSPTPAPTESMPPHEAAADANCDTRITGVDSLTLLRFMAGLGDGGEACPLGAATTQGAEGTPDRGDVDCSGTITGGDAIRILRYTAGEQDVILGNC